MAAQQALNNLELTSIMLQWLKDITLEEHGIEFEDTIAPKISKAWTDLFARLATVNRAFFDASIEVLWERLTTLLPPFGYVLPADKDKNGVPSRVLSYQSCKITSRDWERFRFYASKTKVLVLDKTSPGINPGWFVHLLDSTGRPSTLFPSVRQIYLLAPFPLNLYVANNCASGVQFVGMNLWQARSTSEANDNGRALTAGLYQKATALTELRITNKLTSKMLGNIARILPLQSLHICVGSDVEILQLDRLARLPHLSQLCIKQDLDPDNRTLASTLPSRFLDVRGVEVQKSKLQHLRELQVVANGTTHYWISTTLLPCNLEGLTLRVIPDVLNVQAALIPLFIGIYANGNPSLIRITVEPSNATRGLRADPVSLAPLRQDMRYTKLEPFLQSISSLPNLTCLRISDIPFLAVDMAYRIWMAVRGLPLLQSLVIKPDNMTDLDADCLTLPDWDVLESIAFHSPHLDRLGILLAVENIPPVPAMDVAAPTHTLSHLELDVCGSAEYTEDEKFALARYLERVFPHASIGTAQDGEWKELCGFLDRLLRYSRESRAQVIRQLEMARSEK